jgi:hypothetical protein
MGQGVGCEGKIALNEDKAHSANARTKNDHPGRLPRWSFEIKTVKTINLGSLLDHYQNSGNQSSGRADQKKKCGTHEFVKLGFRWDSNYSVGGVISA